MLIFISADMKVRLEALIEASRNNTTELDKISTQIAGIQSKIELSRMDPENQAHLTQIAQISNVASHYVLQQRVLDAIAFGDMYRRYETVEEAHLKTFKWILDDVVHEDDSERQDAKKLFTDWLASGSGIFHISGKLGSGKSTLMKFLCGHDRTMKLLREWAGKKSIALIHYSTHADINRRKSRCFCNLLLLEARKRSSEVVTGFDALVVTCHAQSNS